MMQTYPELWSSPLLSNSTFNNKVYSRCVEYLSAEYASSAVPTSYSWGSSLSLIVECGETSWVPVSRPATRQDLPTASVL